MVGEAMYRSGNVYHHTCLGPLVTDRSYLDENGSVIKRPMVVVSPGPRPKMLSAYPAVTLIPNFLTAEECAHLRTLALSRLQPSQLGVFYNKDPALGDHRGRTSFSAFIEKSKRQYCTRY